MKLKILVAVMLLLLVKSPHAQAGFYLDIGVGWIEEVTVIQTLGPLESEYTFPIREAYLVLRGGYEYKGWHGEYETIGNSERSFSTLKGYYRWYLK